MSACATCNAENQEELEEIGALAVAGDISWREAARRGGLTHHVGLKTHMTNHWSPPSPAPPLADDLVASTVKELESQARIAPPELKPLYLVAMQNLAGLGQTKPSQQHLIVALRTISEITGMKMEQRFMLEFGNMMFGGGAAVAAPVQPALPPADEDVVDAELV